MRERQREQGWEAGHSKDLDFNPQGTGNVEGAEQGNDPAGTTFRKDGLGFATWEGKRRHRRPGRRPLQPPRHQVLP